MLRARILGTWLAMLMLGACASRWQELTPQSSDRLALDSTKIYALVLAGGDTVRVRHASVVGDSVHWTERVRHGTWIPESGGVGRTEIRQVVVYAGVSGSGAAVGLAMLGAVSVLLLLDYLANSCWAFCRGH